MRYLVSGGGTGGHVYPALAVARALHDARPGLELAYVGGVRGLERRIVADVGDLPYHELVVRSLRSGGVNAHLVLDPLRLAASVPQAWSLLGRLRPQAIFTSGGYLGIPLVMAARARGIPSLVWEGNVVAGRATAAVGRLATRVAVSFPPTLERFPRGSCPARRFDRSRASTGMPRALVRRGAGGPAAAGVRRLAGSGAHDLRAGGRPGAAAGRWRVLHIAGEPGCRMPSRSGRACQPTWPIGTSRWAS